MKDGFIHLIFVIDESGSMYDAVSDVLGSFEKTIEEQKKLATGKCAISLFRFNTVVTNDYLLKDVNDIAKLEYAPNGCTAMNDGIGQAIFEVGKALADMDESERPEKNLVVIMTDGEENSSKEYTLQQVRDMIKEQTDKYNWNFMFVGNDITDSSYSNDLFQGCSGCTTIYTAKSNMTSNLGFINTLTTNYRCCSASLSDKNDMLNSQITTYCNEETEKYENSIGKKIK